MSGTGTPSSIALPRTASAFLLLGCVEHFEPPGADKA
jgi:hypothetical protein